MHVLFQLRNECYPKQPHNLSQRASMVQNLSLVPWYSSDSVSFPTTDLLSDASAGLWEYQPCLATAWLSNQTMLYTKNLPLQRHVWLYLAHCCLHSGGFSPLSPCSQAHTYKNTTVGHFQPTFHRKECSVPATRESFLIICCTPAHLLHNNHLRHVDCFKGDVQQHALVSQANQPTHSVS